MAYFVLPSPPIPFIFFYSWSPMSSAPLPPPLSKRSAKRCLGEAIEAVVEKRSKPTTLCSDAECHYVTAYSSSHILSVIRDAQRLTPSQLSLAIPNWQSEGIILCDECLCRMKLVYLKNTDRYKWIHFFTRSWGLSPCQELLCPVLMDMLSCRADDITFRGGSAEDAIRESFSEDLDDDAGSKNPNYIGSFLTKLFIVLRRILPFQITTDLALGDVRVDLGVTSDSDDVTSSSEDDAEETGEL